MIIQLISVRKFGAVDRRSVHLLLSDPASIRGWIASSPDSARSSRTCLHAVFLVHDERAGSNCLELDVPRTSVFHMLRQIVAKV